MADLTYTHLAWTDFLFSVALQVACQSIYYIIHIEQASGAHSCQV